MTQGGRNVIWQSLFRALIFDAAACSLDRLNAMDLQNRAKVTPIPETRDQLQLTDWRFVKLLMA